jgi:hypothetical protein
MNMPKRSSKGPRDPKELAKVIERATREAERTSRAEGKNPAAVALGRLGGQKGGKARADKLTPDERREIAAKAAKARWKRDRQT